MDWKLLAKYIETISSVISACIARKKIILADDILGRVYAMSRACIKRGIVCHSRSITFKEYLSRVTPSVENFSAT